MTAKYIKLGLESIDFQSGIFHTDLTNAIAALRKDGTYTKESIEQARISEIIKKYTGLKIKLELVPLSIGAGVEVPRVDKNHPLIREGFLEIPAKTGTDLIKFLGRNLKGSVDRKSGKVSGDFERFEHMMIMDEKILSGNKFTDGEISAIILHEVGHVFTYFEYLGYAYKTNMVLAGVVKTFNESKDLKERKMVLAAAEKVLGIQYEDSDELATTKTTDAVEAITISEVSRQMRSEVGENLYNYTAAEQLADEFAARHGASRDLATGLTKFYRHYGNTAVVSTPLFLTLEAIKLVTLAAVAYWSVPVASLIALAAYPTVGNYDDPKTRAEKLKNQLVMQLKSKDLPDEMRKSLLEDIETIESNMNELAKRRGFYELLVETVVPVRRRMRKHNEIQVELERLASNDLYVTSAKFMAGAGNNA